MLYTFFLISIITNWWSWRQITVTTTINAIYAIEITMPNWTKILNHPLFNMGFFLVVRQATKNMDLDNTGYIGVIRGFYLGSQLLVILLSFYLMSVIRKTNDI
ncbi:hypothetical protein BD408DRAFT_222190 [Parasitella parasitica]|nr:hypothetical protein BD408DRAFT_222190 [Parasitella parasitica]